MHTEGPEVRWLGRVDYEKALALQQAALEAIVSGEGPETVFLLEHDPVYTIGRTRERASLGEISELPHPVIETNRGGQATFHGPGQLVGYPVLNLGNRGRDLHRYMRFLEGVLIDSCAHFGVEAQRKDGLTGVWVADRKIASIGVGLRKWITMHGFALNVCNDLGGFAYITPCGIQGVQMSTLQIEAGRAVSVKEAVEVVGAVFLEAEGASH